MPGTDMIAGGGPAFTWCKLEISRGPALPREADKVIRLYRSLQTKYDAARTRDEQQALAEAIDALRTSVEGRIDELENFYMANDVDERAVLFEKQRLALRRLLQSDPHGVGAASAAAKPPPATPAAVASEAATPVVSEKAAKMARVRDKLEHYPKVLHSAQRLLKGKHQPRLAYSSNASPKTKAAFVEGRDVGKTKKELLMRNAKLRAKREKKNTKKAVAPIYAWERGGKKEEKKEEEAKQIFGPVEFQIRLTEKEFFKFTSRRRGMAAAKKHKARFKRDDATESPFLQSTGPYVDPQRVKNSTFRSPNKDKWMDEKGMRPYTHI